MKKVWSEKEINFLKENLTKLNYKQIALLLKRGLKSVTTKANRLGVKNKPKIKDPHTPPDLKEHRFGKLLVLKLSDHKYGPKKATIWTCKCDCGKIVDVLANNLRMGRASSCTKCRNIKPIKEVVGRRSFEQHIKNAARRKYENCLTLEDYCEIASKPCTYCLCFSKRKNRATGMVVDFNSIDRRNNEPFYKSENAQSVCFGCQTMKGALTHEEFIANIRKVAAIINNS